MLNKKFYLLIGLIPIIVFLALLVSIGHSPYLGMEFERKGDKWYVASVDNTRYAHKYDDLIGAEVVEIAGKKIEVDDLVRFVDNRRYSDQVSFIFASFHYFSEHIKIGNPLTLIFLKENQKIVIEIKPSPYPVFKFLINNILNLLIALSFFLIGLITISKKPNDKKVFVFFMICITLTFASIALAFFERDIGYDFKIYLLQFSMYCMSVYYFTPLILIFFLQFPKEYPITKNKLLINVVLWIFPLLGFCAWVIFGQIVNRYLYFIFFFLATSAVIFYTYLVNSSPEIKAQIKVVVWADIIAFSIVISLYLLPLVFFGHPLISFTIVLLMGLLFPLSIAFSIMRYRLLEMDALVDNTIIYTLTVLILAALDIFIIYLLTGTVLAGLNIPQPLVVIFAVWIIIFAYIPVRNFVQNTIKKLLKRELYDIDQVALSLSQQMLSAEDMKAAFQKAVNTITDTLHPKGVEYTLMGERGSIIMENRPLIESVNIISYTKPVPLFEIEFSDKTLPDNYSGGALVPVVGTKGHLGYFILQDKHSQRLYDSEDLKLLSIIASQLALTLEAIQYKEELRKNEAESQKEKERLIKDIHDGLGGTLSSINILSQKGSHGDYPAEVKGLFSMLSDLSKESLFEMRNLYNIIEKKEIEWDVVITEMKNFGAFMLEPHKITLNFRDNISSDAPPSLDNLDFVNIYKIYKEAVSNIVKYSRASRVDVNMNIQKNKLIMSIKDNGTGLQEGLPPPESGRGLKNMQDRASEIGAGLNIISENGVLIYFEKVW